MGQNVMDISNPSVDNSTPSVTRVSQVATGGGPATGASANQSQGNSAAGAAPVGNPTRVGAIVRDVGTKQTRTDGTTGDIIVDLNENQHVREAYAPLAEDNVVGVIKTEQRFSYATSISAATTTIKSGEGFLHKIIVTGGTAGTIDVYDNTAASGAKIATFGSTAATASHEFNVTFSTGLTIVTSAATNITISYR